MTGRIVGLSGLALALALGHAPPAAGDPAAGPAGSVASPEAPRSSPSPEAPGTVDSPEPPDAIESHGASVSADDLLLELDEDTGAHDPLEPSNRLVFGANEA